MSNIIYVVPWAICETDSMYIKKVDSAAVPAPEAGAIVEDWCIKKVIPNPDKRSKDVYAIIDVYNGYDAQRNEKGLSVYSLNNSAEKLLNYGYEKANEDEKAFIRQRVLKIDKSVGRKK